MSNVVPERRFVTVLFADIKGFTSLSENLDPEDVEDIINSIFARFREIIEEHGGYLDKFIGDAVMAVFGAPKSHSDDPRRAILSGLLMQRALEEFNEKHNLSLGLRIGINTGEVLWSSIAGEKATVMGDAVNVAQRLESIGEPGRVFVSEKTKELSEEYFEFEEKGETKVKGRKEPVKVFLVSKEKEHTVLPKGGVLTPLFEREKEIDLLLKAFSETAENKKFQLVFVLGDAGIGKTRLSMEFLRKLKEHPDGVETFLFKADPLKQGSYQLISRIILEKLGVYVPSDVKSRLEELFSKKDSLSEAEIKTFTSLVLATVFPKRAEKGVSKNIMKERINALSSLFEVLFSKDSNPTVIVIDDFHHADEDSFNFIARLKGILSHSPLFLIVNSRKKFESLGADITVPLTPVSKTSLYSFVRFMFDVKDEKIAPEFVEFIKEKTGGNPYYVEELLKYIREKGLYEHRPLRVKSEGLHLPETLKGILTEKIDALPLEEKEIVKVAACIGRVFWQGVLEIVLSKPVEDKLVTLEEEGIVQRESKSLLENDVEYSFLHELLRDAAYALLTKRERTKLHALVGGVLELYEDNATLLYDAARHYAYAQNFQKAYELFEKAGDLAKAQANYTFALQSYDKIDDVSPELLLKKAEALEILSNYDGAARIIEEALSSLEEKGGELYVKLNVRLASIREKEGDFSGALSILEELSGQSSPIIRAEILGRIAWILFRLSRYEEAEIKAKSSLLIINRLSQSNPEVLIRKSMCLNTLANIYMRKGDMENSYKYFVEAMNIYRSLNDKDRLSRILINLSTYLMHEREYEHALAYLNESLKLTTETANRGLLPAIYNNIGLIYLDYGDTEKAIVNFHHAHKISRNLGNRYMEMNVLVNIARAYSSMDLWDDAILYFEKAIEISKALGNKVVEGITLANMSFTYYLKGDLDRAEESAREALFIFGEIRDYYSEIDVLPTLLDTLLEKGLYDEVLGIIDNYLELLHQRNLEKKMPGLLLRKALAFYFKGEKSTSSNILSVIDSNKLDNHGKFMFLIVRSLLEDIGEEELKLVSDISNPKYDVLKELLQVIINKGDISPFLSKLPPSMRLIKKLLAD